MHIRYNIFTFPQTLLFECANSTVFNIFFLEEYHGHFNCRETSAHIRQAWNTDQIKSCTFLWTIFQEIFDVHRVIVIVFNEIHSSMLIIWNISCFLQRRRKTVGNFHLSRSINENRSNQHAHIHITIKFRNITHVESTIAKWTTQNPRKIDQKRGTELQDTTLPHNWNDKFQISHKMYSDLKFICWECWMEDAWCV